MVGQMADRNWQNHPLLRNADPKRNKMVTLFRLEPPLNPYVDDRVIVDAACMFGDYPNSKFIPALHMLSRAKASGALEGIGTLAVPTSGNFGACIGLLAPAFGIHKVILYVKKDAPPSKTHVLEALPAVSVYKYSPGPGLTGLSLAIEAALQKGVSCVNQYGDWKNVDAHVEYTGPAIWKATEKKATVIVAAAGSGGTLGGVGMFCKKQNKKVVTVRAVVAPGEEIPAGRTLKQFNEIVTIDYPPSTFDFTLDCGRGVAFTTALALGQQIPGKPGPTSGETHHVAMTWLAKMKRSESGLDPFRNADGNVHIVEIFADSIDLYAERVTGVTNYEAVNVSGAGI